MDLINAWLLRLTADRPVREIRISGKRYIERHFVGRIRYRLRGRKRAVTAYLHRYLDPDGEREVHDHPWSWSVGVVLCGGYAEERLTGFSPVFGWHSRIRKVRPFVPNFIGPRTFHRIVSVDPNTWTLFLHGRGGKGWGFLKRVNGNMVLYHQPHDVDAFHRWEERAPPARVLREALGE